jgi:hypothetical protein
VAAGEAKQNKKEAARLAREAKTNGSNKTSDVGKTPRTADDPAKVRKAAAKAAGVPERTVRKAMELEKIAETAKSQKGMPLP